ncbi:MAG: DUF2029 domain-containing protein [Pirellulaceae bacterium]|nr:DUF2029 domain-containing protein [Pirellulaceae bacterium]
MTTLRRDIALAGGADDPFGPWTAGRRLGWVLACLVVSSVFLPRYVAAWNPPPYQLIDFFQEWSSARNAVSGRPVYAPVAEAVERYLGLQKVPDGSWDVNVHPPSSVLLALPLQGFAYPTAFRIWNLVSLAALAASVWLVVRNLGIRFSVWSVFPAVLLFSICDPLYQQMLQGQLNLILLLLIVGVWAADRAGRPLLAGGLLGAAAAIKLFPAFLLLYFLARRDGRAVAASAASVLLITLVTLGLLGWETYATYLSDVLPVAATWKAAWNNASLAGFWYKLFAPGPRNGELAALLASPALALAGTAVSVAAVLLVLVPRVVRAATTRARDLAFGLTITAMLLVSPVTWEHYFLLLLLPLVVVWLELPRTWLHQAAWWGLVVVLWGLPIIAVCNVLIPGGFWAGNATPWHTLTLLSVQCYGLCGLLALGWYAARREESASALAVAGAGAGTGRPSVGEERGGVATAAVEVREEVMASASVGLPPSSRAAQ